MYFLYFNLKVFFSKVLCVIIFILQKLLNGWPEYFTTLHNLNSSTGFFWVRIIVKWYTAPTNPLTLVDTSVAFLRLLAAANLLSESVTIQLCLFWDFIVIVLAAVCAFAVEYVFPLKVFWRWHRLPEHSGRLTCRTSNFSACHGGSLSGHRYAQRDLLIGGC